MEVGCTIFLPFTVLNAIRTGAWQFSAWILTNNYPSYVWTGKQKAHHKKEPIFWYRRHTQISSLFSFEVFIQLMTLKERCGALKEINCNSYFCGNRTRMKERHNTVLLLWLQFQFSLSFLLFKSSRRSDPSTRERRILFYGESCAPESELKS